MATSDIATGSRSVNGGPTSYAMYDATRKRRKNKRIRKNSHGTDVHDLNITPMLDMMTILLVFLLKSFASSSQDVNVANLVLPHSSTKIAVEEALTLMITQNEIMVDQKLVTNLDNGAVRPEDLPEGPNGYLIKPLYDVLEARADHLKRIEEFGGTQFVGRVAVIADKTTNYKLLFRILYTAGRAEFGLFKLFVQKRPE